jgi:transcription initiation factor TFIID TATA-box-binding protein
MTKENRSQDLEIHGIQLHVVNLSATYSLDRELDLGALSRDLPNSEYNPEQYSSLVLRVPGGTFLIPRSGKITLVGVENKDNIEPLFKRFIDTFQKLGIYCELDPDGITIQNIVITGEFETDINLKTLAIGLGFEKVEYEPEQFPGLVYRGQGGVVLFFGSGKFIITGLSEFNQIEPVASSVYKKLESLDIEVN